MSAVYQPGFVDDGGVPARRAMIRWAWRLFKREWRQQILILALITVAVAATILGAAVASNTPPPANAGFGTAHYRASIQGTDPQLKSKLASFSKEFGRTDVIENQVLPLPGSTTNFQLRSQSPNGAFSKPMLTLISGKYPVAGDQVALTPDLAQNLNLKVGDTFGLGGKSRKVVGIVEDPQSLLDQFALVLPGQITAPTTVTILFNIPKGVSLGAGLVSKPVLGRPLSLPAIRPMSFDGVAIDSASTGPAGPLSATEAISIAALTLGMLLIALVAVGGFTVVAQRRMRAFGVLESLGATDENVKLVVKADGVIVGILAALIGVILALVGWLAYRPILESSSHHMISLLAVPWTVVVASVLLATVAAYFAASQPARSLTRASVAASLMARPAPPKQLHRSAVPGVVLLAAAFVVVGLAGKLNFAGLLIVGLVLLVVAVIFLSPLFLAALGRAGRKAPVALRLAFRDLARYRTRSGSVLSAVSLGILVSVMISSIAAVRFSNPLDYVGPNLSLNQLLVHVPPTPPTQGKLVLGTGVSPASSQAKTLGASVGSIAKELGITSVVELDSANANLRHATSGRNWMGPIYVATPQLLKAFGISSSSVSSNADILTMRPGLSGETKMQLIYGTNLNSVGLPGSRQEFPCPKSDCLANPVIQQIKGLPSGTSAPNTVITEAAIKKLGLTTTTDGWLMQGSKTLTNAQLTDAQQAAAAAGLVVESRNTLPTSSTIISWATAFGVALAIAILVMSIGLLRSETAADLRTLAATGATSFTRRNITAATAGGLGFLGAILGTMAGYVGVIGWFTSSVQGRGISALANIPFENLAIVIVGVPLLAATLGWLLAGRAQPNMARQAIE